ncbi:hypothetical protein RZS08_31765, partial [Arthrospira platensis SPKY1]|nr:hypothetical protein [Arthrospira platensis SPKY1]
STFYSGIAQLLTAKGISFSKSELPKDNMFSCYVISFKENSVDNDMLIHRNRIATIKQRISIDTVFIL